MEINRSSGILMHITSLPSAFGIGDIGPAAYEFIDFLESSGHQYWQLLPLNPTDEVYEHSPYSTFSAFAGNPLLISPELLENDGFLNLKDLPSPKGMSKRRVNFSPVREYKKALLEAAFQTFRATRKKAAFSNFCKKHAFWLDDFSMYQALIGKFGKQWPSWPSEIRDRAPEALQKEQEALEESVEKEKFLQFLFFSQWERLVKYAHRKKVSFIGDVPFYINHYSVDCWANPQCFKLDLQKQPTKISGVPPDLFSENGQLWGTPVYDWKFLESTEFRWWLERIKQNLLLFDVVRLDHFRGFSAFWEVPAKEKTAKKGKWTKAPGTAFFEKVQKVFPDMPFIAEDLGSLDQAVNDLVEKFHFPGMKVLQFAFGDHMAENPYIPYNHSPNSIVYTGTHDNDTTRGWYRSLGKLERKNLRDYTPHELTSQNVHFVLHRMALNSVAKLAIVPLQDILGLGSSAKMNIPGTTKGNWSWRITSEEIPWERTLELRRLNSLYGRTR